MPKLNTTRLILFVLVGLVHLLVIVFTVVKLNTIIDEPEPAADVMKLVDIREEVPLPPRQPSPLQQLQNTTEAVAERMIETDEPISNVVYAGGPPVQTENIDYLPMHKISTLPVFPEKEIRDALVYPPIARRSNIEGLVYLELFVDAQGEVRRVIILQEEPLDRGFGAAAVKAFQGLRGSPALANGGPVAVRCRYPVRFTLK